MERRWRSIGESYNLNNGKGINLKKVIYFDEEIFKDSNYSVDLKNTIFICTYNYSNKGPIRKKLGDPIYYRFNKFIKFEYFSIEDIQNIFNAG